MKQFLIFLLLVILAWLIIRDRVTGRAASLKQPLESVLSGMLIDRSGEPVDTESIAKADYRLIYFSAHWCPPCQQFTPVLVQTYNQLKEQGGFEVIFVSADRSEKEMLRYMRETEMPWPATRFESAAATSLRNALAGPGIPCLVMLDNDGKIMADSYEGKRYTGPHKVLDQFKATLATTAGSR
jgi:nucleoredoxin